MADAQLIDGKAIAAGIHEETRQRVEALKAKGVQPGVTFVRVGEDPASQAYVRMKHKKAEELGIVSDTVVLPAETTEEDVLALVRKLNADAMVHGILVQSPMGKHISDTKVFATVAPEKDVDGFNPVNFGKLLLGQSGGFWPCTPAGVHQLLIRCNIPTEGAEVAILGRGILVGKPMAAILMQKASDCNATVTLLHSRSKDIAEHCRRADILIAAMGQTEFVKAAMVKPGATVIDVGVNRVDDPSAKKGYRLVGDVEFEPLCAVAGHITPNPGGVGPMTIAMLMSNTVTAAEMASQ